MPNEQPKAIDGPVIPTWDGFTLKTAQNLIAHFAMILPTIPRCVWSCTCDNCLSCVLRRAFVIMYGPQARQAYETALTYAEG